MMCPMCGGELRDSVSACGSCPVQGALPGDCRMLCCEKCGYETVAPHSVTVDFFKRLFRRRRPKEARAS